MANSGTESRQLALHVLKNTLKTFKHMLNNLFLRLGTFEQHKSCHRKICNKKTIKHLSEKVHFLAKTVSKSSPQSDSHTLKRV